MKKAIIVILLVVLLVGALFFFKNQKNQEEVTKNAPKTSENEIIDSNIWTKDNVKIEIVKSSISNSSVKIKITDKNKEPASYSEDFELEIYDGEKWLDKIEKENSVNPKKMEFHPDQNGEIEFTCDIEKIYGKISEGTYRIVKKVQKNNNYETLYSDNFEIK